MSGTRRLTRSASRAWARLESQALRRDCRCDPPRDRQTHPRPADHHRQADAGVIRAPAARRDYSRQLSGISDHMARPGTKCVAPGQRLPPSRFGKPRSNGRARRRGHRSFQAGGRANGVGVAQPDGTTCWSVVLRREARRLASSNTTSSDRTLSRQHCKPCGSGKSGPGRRRSLPSSAATSPLVPRCGPIERDTPAFVPSAPRHR
jgi:hypothetical protein